MSRQSYAQGAVNCCSLRSPCLGFRILFAVYHIKGPPKRTEFGTTCRMSPCETKDLPVASSETCLGSIGSHCQGLPSKPYTPNPSSDPSQKTPRISPNRSLAKNPPLGSREWKNGSDSSYNCTPFLHSLLTKDKKMP